MQLPLVLVHGWAGSADAWGPLIEAFDDEVWSPVIAMALPGSPGSSSTRPARIASAAEELIDILRELPRAAVVVGHSMGAQVTLLAHASAPDLIAAEIVIDPAYGPAADEAPAFAEWARRIEREGYDVLGPFFQEALRGLEPATAASVLADVERTPIDVIASYLRSEYLDDDAIGLFPAVTQVAARRRHPLLAIHSNEAAAATELRLRPPVSSRIEEWPGYGHFLHLEDPVRFAATVDAWGRGLRPHPDAAANVYADHV